MITYGRYWAAMIRCATHGPRTYYVWLGMLAILILVGMGAYAQQLDQGLIVTHMTNQVSWGAYIANFTFLVGVAAAAVLLVFPTYVFKRKETKDTTLIAELMAVSAIVMCLLFVTVDLGHPERFIHMIPGFGRLNFPSSILAWDVIVLNGYLLLNLHIPGYLLYKKYLGQKPSKLYYLPFIFLSIGWALSIHTVTAFLYSGLGGRPFWNTALLAPRFLVSAFVSGPCLLLIALAVIEHFKAIAPQEATRKLLRTIVTFMLPLNFFLLGCELFTEFYTNTTHTLSATYLWFGINGHAMLTPYIWGAIVMEVIAFAILLVPSLRTSPKALVLASVLAILGVWTEKGMGLIIPGFIPSPAGDLVEYAPSLIEFLVCLGIWALGAFLFTVMIKVALAIQTGRLRHRANPT